MFQQNIARPVKREQLVVKQLPGSFVIPNAGNDKQYVYVRTVQPDSPFDYLTTGHITFERKTLPPEHSLKSNQGKQLGFNIPLIYLTAKQAKAILERAKQTEIVLPRTKERARGEITTLDKHILLEKMEDYQKRLIPKFQPYEVPSTPPENPSDALYESQTTEKAAQKMERKTSKK